MRRSHLPARISAVTLDAGGVLALPSVDGALSAHGVELDPAGILAAHHTAVAVEDALLAARTLVDDRLGEERAAYYAAFAAAVGLTGDAAAALVADMADIAAKGTPWLVLAPGAREVVPALNALGVPVAIVSNSDGTVAAQLTAMGVCQTGTGRHGEVAIVVDSGAVGIRKPDPAIFDHAVAVLDVPREETLHVGDVVAFDIAAATAAGLGAAHYDVTERCHGDHAHVASLAQLVALVEERRPLLG